MSTPPPPTHTQALSKLSQRLDPAPDKNDKHRAETLARVEALRREALQTLLVVMGSLEEWASPIREAALRAAAEAEAGEGEGSDGGRRGGGLLVRGPGCGRSVARGRASQLPGLTGPSLETLWQRGEPSPLHPLHALRCPLHPRAARAPTWRTASRRPRAPSAPAARPSASPPPRPPRTRSRAASASSTPRWVAATYSPPFSCSCALNCCRHPGLGGLCWRSLTSTPPSIAPGRR
jgi:hypothetical protein